MSSTCSHLSPIQQNGSGWAIFEKRKSLGAWIKNDVALRWKHLFFNEQYHRQQASSIQWNSRRARKGRRFQTILQRSLARSMARSMAEFGVQKHVIQANFPPNKKKKSPQLSNFGGKYINWGWNKGDQSLFSRFEGKNSKSLKRRNQKGLRVNESKKNQELWRSSNLYIAVQGNTENFQSSYAKIWRCLANENQRYQQTRSYVPNYSGGVSRQWRWNNRWWKGSQVFNDVLKTKTKTELGLAKHHWWDDKPRTETWLEET